MSHLRPPEKNRRHRKSDCRRGRHFYGEPQNIGAGITRQVCEVCAVVTIDLTNAYEPATPAFSRQGSITSLGNRDP